MRASGAAFSNGESRRQADNGGVSGAGSVALAIAVSVPIALAITCRRVALSSGLAGPRGCRRSEAERQDGLNQLQ